MVFGPESPDIDSQRFVIHDVLFYTAGTGAKDGLLTRKGWTVQLTLTATEDGATGYVHPPIDPSVRGLFISTEETAALCSASLCYKK